MDFSDEVVIHKVFGKGKIIKLENNYITVLFDKSKEEKNFVYPTAFGAFLEIENKSFLEKIKEDKNAILQKEEEDKRIKEERIKIDIAKSKSNKIKNSKKTTKKSIDKNNIAFKCNYCDGGKNTENIGYKGVCSDKIIDYNIREAKYVWCRGSKSQCHRYWKGEITREELYEYYKKDRFTCYESQMLESWRAYAGTIQNGDNKGKPKTLRNVSLNSLALLTTRLPHTEDEERFIFAVFLVNDNYEGDDLNEGYVEAHSKYRMELSFDEAKILKFWDYYFNPNKPERIKFGSVLHRYLTDVQSVQILKKIYEIKKGTPEEKLSKEFLEYYCEIKQLDIDNIPMPNGALQKDNSKSTQD